MQKIRAKWTANSETHKESQNPSVTKINSIGCNQDAERGKNGVKKSSPSGFTPCKAKLPL